MQQDLEAAIPVALLQADPIRLEMGIERFVSGTLAVACRTIMPGCNGAMLEWWFKYFDTDEHLRWWHPIDHKRHFGWDEFWKKGENYIGATIIATESLGEVPPVKATIKFLSPAAYFCATEIDDAKRVGGISAVFYAGIGFGDDVDVDERGIPTSGRMIHVARDTPDGLVLRSRFALGLDSAKVGHVVPDEVGLGLMRHCHSEFSFLARALPSAYYGDLANPRPSDNW